jgi:hypothetical protein
MRGVVGHVGINGKPFQPHEEFPGNYSIRLKAATPNDGLAVTGAGHPVPRTPRRYHDLSTARQLIAAELKLQGLQVNRPQISEALMVDLDGDGADEILIAAQSEPEDNQSRHPQYSVVLIALPVGERPRYIRLHASVRAAQPDESEDELHEGRLLAVADVNGDGTMELVLDKQEESATGIQVFTYRNHTVRLLFESWYGG